jgi:hypothetical protein
MSDEFDPDAYLDSLIQAAAPSPDGYVALNRDKVDDLSKLGIMPRDMRYKTMREANDAAQRERTKLMQARMAGKPYFAASGAVRASASYSYPLHVHPPRSRASPSSKQHLSVPHARCRDCPSTGKAKQILEEHCGVDVSDIITSEQLKEVWKHHASCPYIQAGILVFDYGRSPEKVLPLSWNASLQAVQHFQEQAQLKKWTPPATPAAAIQPSSAARRTPAAAIDLQDDSDSPVDEDDIANVPSTSRPAQAPTHTAPKNGRLLAARGGVKKP